MNGVTDQANDAVPNALRIGFIVFLAGSQALGVILPLWTKHFFARESVLVCGAAPPCKIKFIPAYTRKRCPISRCRRIAIRSFEVLAPEPPPFTDAIADLKENKKFAVAAP